MVENLVFILPFIHRDMSLGAGWLSFFLFADIHPASYAFLFRSQHLSCVTFIHSFWNMLYLFEDSFVEGKVHIRGLER